MPYDDLDELPVAILDGYWTLCTPTEAMLFFVDEYLSMNFEGKPMYLNDHVVSDRDVVVALSQLLAYFASKDDGDDALIAVAPRHPSLRKVIADYLGRKRTRA